jgi:phenylalanyl-tRNA synthetase beta chain
VPSHRSDEERVVEKARDVMTAAGFDEAVTSSAIRDEWSTAFSPWTENDPIVCNTPILRGAGILRRSLIPSLLEVKRINQSLGNSAAELFETAKVYLPKGEGLPREPKMLGIVSGGDFLHVKGAVESLVAAVNPSVRIEVQDTPQPLLDAERSCVFLIGEQTLGYLGEVTPAGLKQFGLRNSTSVAEIDLSVLESAAELVPQHRELSQFPAIARDLNFVVDESLRWSALADVVRQSAGECLEDVQYVETFRDAKRDGAGKKRLLLTVTLRSADRTLTSEEADNIRDQIVAACGEKNQARLLV